MSQTSYGLNQGIAFPGTKVDMADSVVDTYYASEPIEFGAGVVANATEQNQVDVADSASGKFRGIALHTNIRFGSYKAQEPVNVARRGKFWVNVTVAVSQDQPAYVNVGAAGKFTNVATGNLPTGGVFRSSTPAAGLAQIEINLP